MEWGARINKWMQSTWEAFEIASEGISNLYSTFFFLCIPGQTRWTAHTTDHRLAGSTFGTHLVSSLLPLTFSDPPEMISLQILAKGPIIEESNVTLKCHADGNPPPSSFNFYFQVSQKPYYTAVCFRRPVGQSDFSRCLTRGDCSGHFLLEAQLPFFEIVKREKRQFKRHARVC